MCVSVIKKSRKLHKINGELTKTDLCTAVAFVAVVAVAVAVAVALAAGVVAAAAESSVTPVLRP